MGVLLRTALQMLESEETSRWNASPTRRELAFSVNGEHSDVLTEDENDPALIEVDDLNQEPLTRMSGPRYLAARSEWLDAERECRCIQVVGDAMSPILMDGAYVAFAKSEETLSDLDGKMVVAWIDHQPMVRWFQFCDRFALLRAENSATLPSQILVDLDTDGADRKIRRVLWINTPH